MELKKKKLVSIIFPSRGRLDLVEKFLLSIETTTYNKEWIEVISICDQDDTDTIELFTRLSSKLTYDFFFICRPRKLPFNLSKDYHVYTYKMCSDSYFIWGLGNDCEILSQDWDINLYHAMAESNFNILEDIELDKSFYYVIVSDGGHWNVNGNINKYGDQSCCFPMVSNNYCSKVQEYMPSDISAWGADTVLFQLVSQSKLFNVVYANSIVGVKHYSHHDKSYIKDDVAKNMEMQSISKNHDERQNFDLTKYKFLFENSKVIAIH